jgi:hypothetical protein
MAEDGEPHALTRKALDRMRRAWERGTGCYLTSEMIQNMSVSVFGEMWHEDETAIYPRKHPTHHFRVVE